MNFNCSVPINSLSFGLCGYNLLKQFYEKGLSPAFFPIGPVDLTCFDKVTDDFKLWLESCIRKSLKSYSKKNPTIRLWHLGGSEVSQSEKQYLISFYETNQPTAEELNIVKNQEKIFFTSQFTVDVFRQAGAENVEYLPLGFDTENFFPTGKHPYNNQKTVIGIVGKWEPSRKKTDKLIRLFLKRFGNNPNYVLHLHTFNVHLGRNPDESAAINSQLIQQCFDGHPYWNVNPANRYFPTLTELNKYLNQIDIFWDGSGAENWGLPGFHAAGIGKHIVAVNENGVKSWATPENACLVAPGKMIDCYDGMFFHKGHIFNQGEFPEFDEDAFNHGIDLSLARFAANKQNIEGLKIPQNFTWSKTADILLDTIK